MGRRRRLEINVEQENERTTSEENAFQQAILRDTHVEILVELIGNGSKILRTCEPRRFLDNGARLYKFEVSRE